MTDEGKNLLPERNVGGDSLLAKVWLEAIESIRFIAGNTDRELAGKVFAVVVAFGYLVAVVVISRAITPIVPVTVALLVPLGLIWFPLSAG